MQIRIIQPLRPSVSRTGDHSLCSRPLTLLTGADKLFGSLVCSFFGYLKGMSAVSLTVSLLKMRGDRPGEFVAQIKIPARALCISAIKPEQGLGMSHVDGIFERTPFARTGGIEMRELHAQGL